MKRFLALLLAVVLLCGAALAEEHGLEINWQADTAAMADYFKVIGMAEEDRMLMADAIATLLNTLKVQAVWKDDGTAAQGIVNLQGEELVSGVYVVTDGTMYMSTNLLPGCVLKAEASEAQEAADVMLLAKELKSVWDAWLGAIDVKMEQGLFSGNAYSGGDSCSTYVFSDEQVGMLAKAMLENDTLAAAAQQATRKTKAKLLNDLEKKLAEVQQHYTYQLRVVREGEQVIGLSLTVLLADAPVLTVSLGVQPQSLRLVVCYAQQELAQYEDVQLEQLARSEQSAELKLSWKHFVSDGSKAFPAVSAGEPTMTFTAAAALSWQDESLGIQLDLNAQPVDIRMTVRGQAALKGKIDLTSVTRIGEQGTPCWTMNVRDQNTQVMTVPSTENALNLDKLGFMDQLAIGFASMAGIGSLIEKLTRLVPDALAPVIDQFTNRLQESIDFN